jgi:hypothetical protein
VKADFLLTLLDDVVLCNCAKKVGAEVSGKRLEERGAQPVKAISPSQRAVSPNT